MFALMEVVRGVGNRTAVDGNWLLSDRLKQAQEALKRGLTA